MTNPELLKDIQEGFAAGKTEAQIREELKAKAYPEAEIDNVIAGWKLNPTLPVRHALPSFIGASWDVYKQLFRRFVELYARIILRLIVWMLPFIVLIVGMRVADNMDALDKSIADSGTFVLAAIACIIAIYHFIWIQVGVIKTVKDRASAEYHVDAITAESKPLIGPYFGTSLLVGLRTILWFLLLIIPGLIYGVYYSLAEYIVVDKGVKYNEAIRMSKKYIEGMWSQVFFSYLKLVAVSILVFIAAEMIGQLVGGDKGADVLSAILNLFYGPYAVIYAFLLYENIKSLKPEIH